MKKSYRRDGISCEPGVCDLVFRDGALTAIKTKQDIIQGQMLSYDDSEIEIEDYGRIHHNGKLPVTRPMEMCLKNPYRMSFWAI